MGVGERLHRQRKLHLRVPGFMDARGAYRLHNAVHVHKPGVQGEPWEAKSSFARRGAGGLDHAPRVYETSQPRHWPVVSGIVKLEAQSFL